MKYFLIFLIVIGFVANVFAIDSKEIELDKQFTIKTEQTISLDNLKVTFLEIVEDSRCPSDVTCVWQGRASIKINAENEDHSEDMILTIGENSTEQIEMYKINLIDLSPYPISKKIISPGEYVATMNISKDKESPVPPPLKQYKAGISVEDIKCKQDLVLIQKGYKIPACVTEKTKQILIERGWEIKTD
jgi:hypothetical protein